jgi:hypothetical protein
LSFDLEAILDYADRISRATPVWGRPIDTREPDMPDLTTDIAAARETYPHIVRWCEFISAGNDTVNARLQRAVDDDAPLDVIHPNGNGGRWATLDDIVSPAACTFMGIPTPTFRVWSDITAPNTGAVDPMADDPKPVRWAVGTRLTHRRATDFVALLHEAGFWAESEREEDE